MTTIEIDLDKYEGAIADILIRRLKGDTPGVITTLGFLHDKLEQDGIENDLHLIKTMTFHMGDEAANTIIYPPVRIYYMPKTNKVEISQMTLGEEWASGSGVSGVIG